MGDKSGHVRRGALPALPSDSRQIGAAGKAQGARQDDEGSPAKHLAVSKAQSTGKAQGSRFYDDKLRQVDMALREYLPNVLAEVATSYLASEEEEAAKFADKAADFLTLAMKGSDGEAVARLLDRCFVHLPNCGGKDFTLDISRIPSEKGQRAVFGLLGDEEFVQLLHERAAQRGGSLSKVASLPQWSPGRIEWPQNVTQPGFLRYLPEVGALGAVQNRIVDLWRTAEAAGGKDVARLREEALVLARHLFESVHVTFERVGYFLDRPFAKIDVTAATSVYSKARGIPLPQVIRKLNEVLTDPFIRDALERHGVPQAGYRDYTMFPLVTLILPPRPRQGVDRS